MVLEALVSPCFSANPFTISVSPTSGSVTRGKSITATVDVKSNGGFWSAFTFVLSIGSASVSIPLGSSGGKLYYYLAGVTGMPTQYFWTSYYYGEYWSPTPGVTYVLLGTASLENLMYYYMVGVTGMPTQYFWTSTYYGTSWNPTPGVGYVLLEVAATFKVVRNDYGPVQTKSYTVTISAVRSDYTASCTYALTVS
jgi:hypothetical protein